ncbi:MAG: RNA polymerase sigma factor [Planctomycetota bacterium]
MAVEPRCTFTSPGDEAIETAENNTNTTTDKAIQAEPDEDADLIALCKKGVAAGYRTLYDKYGHRIYAFARRFLSDDQHAEDVTQEVFVQVFRKLEGFRGDSKFSTWLFRVTVNSCKNKRRWVEREKRLDQRSYVERTRTGEPAAPPERELGQRELRDEIERALNALTEEQRSLILLKGVKNLSYEEIGCVLGQSENQIRGKLYRARKVFRDALAARRARFRDLDEHELEAEVLAELGG